MTRTIDHVEETPDGGPVIKSKDVTKKETRIAFLYRRLAKQLPGSNGYKKTQKTILRHERDLAALKIRLVGGTVPKGFYRRILPAEEQ